MTSGLWRARFHWKPLYQVHGVLQEQHQLLEKGVGLMEETPMDVDLVSQELFQIWISNLTIL